MRTPFAPVIAAVLAASALLVSACGNSTNEPAAVAPTTSPQVAPTVAPPVTAVPAATGPVTGTGTVIETPGNPPELCMGPIRESWPPQCDGIALSGWDWAANPPDAQSETGSPLTRWGIYAVEGTFDGRTLAVTGAVSLALYDPMAEPSVSRAAPPELSDAEWDAVSEALRAAPGLLTTMRVNDTGPVMATVVHDDGSIQAWADASFGVGVVVVTSGLR